MKPKSKRRALPADEQAIREHAGQLLGEIQLHGLVIARAEAEMQQRIENIRAEYEEDLSARRIIIGSADKALLQLMKFESKTLFAAGDVVTLPGGSLVRNKGWKVTIPRNALGKCEELGFDDVIKTVKSLDREAVEKWDESKLAQIGAERKPATKYSYEVKAR